MNIIDIMIENNLTGSKTQAKQLIQQKGVKYKTDEDSFGPSRKTHWQIIEEFDWQPLLSGILKVGKRKYLHLLLPWTVEKLTKEQYEKELEDKNE